jgi:Delta24-sterol reductase
MDQHRKAVADIAAIVKSFHDRKEAFRIYHGSTNSTRPPTFDRSKIVDTSHLTNILHINEEEQWAIVEPNVPMDKLVCTTLKQNLIPLVVPEFPGITVGGSFAGTAAESSSFKFGFFDRTVDWCDMILANGEVAHLGAKDDQATSTKIDLFHGSVGTLGTLGVLVLFQVRLRRARRYVELHYTSITRMQSSIDLLRRDVHKAYDFLEAILFSKNEGVVVSGVMVEHAQNEIVHFTRAQDPWFYLHVIENGGFNKRFTVPIFDYLFRYDRGAFWMGSYAFKHIPFNRLTRLLLNRSLNTRKLYKALHSNNHVQKYIIQDLAIPENMAERCLTYLDENFKIYPLWLCPIRADSKAPMHQVKGKDLIINVGVWGRGTAKLDEFIEKNRMLEKVVHELGGWKWLYAHVYYSEDEFWQIHGRKWYDDLRQKYGASNLPTIYDKIKARDNSDELSLRRKNESSERTITG